MKKLYLLILIIISSIFVNAQNCDYGIELYDTFGDGWAESYVIVKVNGLDVDTLTLNGITDDGTEMGVYLNVAIDDTIDIDFYANGALYPEECRFKLFDCKSQNVSGTANGYGDENENITGVIVNCDNCMSGDCANAQPVCNDASINSNPNGSGYNDDLNASNWGTLITGENFSNWVHFKTQVDCEICLDITNPNSIDYDFAIWDGTDCPPSAQPIRCSYARMVGGLPVSAYYTGMRNTETCIWEDANTKICDGSTADGYVSCINAVAGQEFTLLIDNWDGISTPFTLNWSFSVVDPLNCDLILPVEFITSSYNCTTHTLQWQTVSEINNDYFTLKVGKSYNNNELVVDNEYIVYGNGNSNQFIQYEYKLNVNNAYVQIWQTDYDGTSVLLNTNYIGCDEKEKPISIYPNYITDGSYVNIDGNYKSIQVYDMLGTEVYPQISNNKISGLKSGIYIVVIDKKYKNKLIVN